MPAILRANGKWTWGWNGGTEYPDESACRDANEELADREERAASRLADVYARGTECPIEEAAQVVRDYMSAAQCDAHAKRAFGFEIVRAEGDSRRIIEGTASVDGFAGDGVLLDPEGFGDAIREFMEFGIITSGHRLLPEFTVGRALNVDWQDGVGMGLRAMISEAPDVESVWIKAQEKILRGLSVQFWVLDGEWDEALEAFRATRFLIPETAIVPLPRDRGATFEVGRGWRFARGASGVLGDRKRRGLFLQGALEIGRPETPETDDVGEDAGHQFVRSLVKAAVVAGARARMQTDATILAARSVG